MIIASFNINGIRARMPVLTEWLGSTKPDVAILQETKIPDDKFPHSVFEDLGYNVAFHGQKSFNGVAILSKLPLEDVRIGLDGDDEDDHARYIEATVVGNTHALRICGLYLPNGNPAPGPKFDYKLGWMERLRERARVLLAREEAFVMAGDYNIIPQAEDAAHPDDWREDALFRVEAREAFRKLINLGLTDAWREDALFRPESRAAFHRLVNLGLTDAFRAVTPVGEGYTFWDYQRGAWNRNDGIRIDHFLLSPQCADLLVDCRIDKEVRGLEKPSDHVPIWVELDA